MANIYPFFFFIFLFGALQLAVVDGESELNFTYSFTTEISLLGNAAPASIGKSRYISLMPWSNLILRDNWAWATYDKAVPFWIHPASSRTLANFSSSFSFDISANVADKYWGGFTFFMAPFDLEPPIYGEGQWLGLFNQTSNQIVAVEFDTFMNSPFDMDKNHVGIDVNGIVSKVNVSVSDIDRLNEGQGMESVGHGVQRNRKRNVILLFVPICLALLVVTAMVGLAMLLACWRRGKTNKFKTRELDKQFSQGPQKYSYAALRAATNNFSNDEMLGKGGFGQVYRGILSSSNETVAVKRVSQGSKQGEKEYIAEVSIISKLRHRNLVQLYGWCHEKGQLLLVYEYLPNGSLDKYLFGDLTKGDLNWMRRYSITCDIASALLYLHEEWDHRVVHRDIKASNVMLDGHFNAKLGDFGLARVIERERAASDTTMVAGTCGYVAPECFITGKASSESDVFSFGAVCLEIACGKRAVDRTLDDHNWRLVEWVWDLYGKGKICEAADAKLHGNFSGEEMERVLLVGLSCSHPDPRARLSIRQVVDILKMKSPLPPLPPSYPEAVYTTCHAPIFALSSMSDGTFCTAENT